MIHYVLLKFKPGTDLDAAEKQIRETYEALDRELPFFHDPKTYRCCVERDSNADISKAKELLGYDPDYDFANGIALAIDWYKENL